MLSRTWLEVKDLKLRDEIVIWFCRRILREHTLNLKNELQVLPVEIVVHAAAIRVPILAEVDGAEKFLESNFRNGCSLFSFEAMPKKCAGFAGGRNKSLLPDSRFDEGY